MWLIYDCMWSGMDQKLVWLYYAMPSICQWGSWSEGFLIWSCGHLSLVMLTLYWPCWGCTRASSARQKNSCILQSFSPWLIPQTKRMRTRRLLWMTFWVLKVLLKPLATPCRFQTCISPTKHFSWVLDTAKKCVWLWALIWRVLSLYWYSVVCFY